MPTKEELKNIISEMIRESQKIKKITEVVTSANFDMNSRKITEDIVEFIKEYIEGFKSSAIKTEINAAGINFEIPFSPLEMQIIIDNIYDNAIKNGANLINLKFKGESKNKIKISFMDNGKKVKKNI